MILSPESPGPSTRRARRERERAQASVPLIDEHALSADSVLSPADDASSASARLAALFAQDTDSVKHTDSEADADGPAEDAPATHDALEPAALPDLEAESEQVRQPEPEPARHPDAQSRDDLSRALFPTAALQVTAADDAASALFGPHAAAETEVEPEAPRVWTDEKHPPTALTWLDPTAITTAAAEPPTAPDLFADARLTPGWRRARVLVPLGIVAALCGSYIATTLMWPLNSVAPTVQAANVEIEPAPAATITWPSDGTAAVGIQGLAPLSSSSQPAPIASISKVVSALMVLDEMPLEPGEQGPSFTFTQQDSWDFWRYRRTNQSSLDVPVGGSLTEYQMLQGVLLGSANNYIDRLSDEIWGSDRAFAEASATWLEDRGIDGITLSSPSGFDDRNVASPEALIQLGELAMKNPVFAEIVGTRSVELPGAGVVTNTNGMLDDAGVVGVKTGTLRGDWNLLTAKDVMVGETAVHVFAAVLGQDDDKARLAETRSLLAQVEASLTGQPAAVPQGTVVGTVRTEWGEKVDIATDADVSVVLFNGAGATATTTFDLGDKRDAGAAVGSLTAQGPLDEAKTTVSLTDEIAPPSFWWRLTHPLELFGLDKA